MNKKGKWVDEVLQSLDGIQRAEPANDLFDKIMAKLPEKKQAVIIPIKRLRWLVAAACLIIGLNIYVLSIGMQSSQKENTSESQSIELLTDFSLYE